MKKRNRRLIVANLHGVIDRANDIMAGFNFADDETNLSKLEWEYVDKVRSAIESASELATQALNALQ